MTNDEAILKLIAIGEKHYGDKEVIHIEADEVLLACAPPAVREAYIQLKDRTGFWYA